MARTSYKDRLIPARRRSVYFYCPVLPLVNRCFSPYTPLLCVLTAMTYYSFVCYGLLSFVSPLWETDPIVSNRFFVLFLRTVIVSHVITKMSNIYIDVGGCKKPLNTLKIQDFLKGDSLIH